MAVGLAVAFVALGAYVTVRMQMQSSLDESLLARATQAADAGLLGSTASDGGIPSSVLGAADVRIIFLAVGSRPVSADSGPPLQLGVPELRVLTGRSAHSVRTTTAEGSHWRVATVPDGQGKALVIAQSLDPQEAVLSKLGVVMLLFGLAGVIAAAMAGWAVARNGLRPVRRLTSSVEHIARSEDLSGVRSSCPASATSWRWRSREADSAVEHLVERRGEARDLVGALDRQRGEVLGARDVLDRAGQPPHRPQAVARDCPAGHRRGDHAGEPEEQHHHTELGSTPAAGPATARCTSAWPGRGRDGRDAVVAALGGRGCGCSSARAAGQRPSSSGVPSCRGGLLVAQPAAAARRGRRSGRRQRPAPRTAASVALGDLRQRAGLRRRRAPASSSDWSSVDCSCIRTVT